MKTYETEFEIEAPVEKVWEVLVDFPRYGEWNPSLPDISGKLAVGETLSMTLGMPGRPSIGAKAVVQSLDPGRGFVWEGHLGADWLFLGHREFAVRALGENRSSFHHVERLTGPLVPLFLLFMDKACATGHADLNRAIKQRAETWH